MGMKEKRNMAPGAIVSRELQTTTFRQKIAGIRGLLALSAVMAVLCTFVSYPGIFYSDSYVRVETAKAILNAVVKTLTGRRFILETGNAFTIVPSFFMAGSYGLTGGFGMYTFLQAFTFFTAVLLLIRELNPPGKGLLYWIFSLSPVIYGASVYYEANIGCASGIIALVLLFRRIQEPKMRRERAVEFLLICFASFVTVGYRTNALTVIPVLAIYLWITQKTFLRRLLPMAAMMAGIALTWLIPWAFGVQSESNLATGFVWEIITAIQQMEAPEQAAYLDYLDEIGGEGTTRQVLQSSNESTVDGFMWGGAINTKKLSEPGVAGKVFQKYFQLIKERPADFFRMKLRFIGRALGIGEMLDLNEYDYNRWNRMKDYGFNDSDQRKRFHQSFLTANEMLGFYSRRPWVAFLISLIFVIVESLHKNPQRRLYILLFLLAVFHYGAYLVVIVVFEIRMFYPALLFLMILDAAISAEWICAGFQRIRTRTVVSWSVSDAPSFGRRRRSKC